VGDVHGSMIQSSIAIWVIMSVKLGCLTIYLGLVILASCISIMLVVMPVLFSRVLITVVLWFALWEIILMVPASRLYLFMSIYRIIVISSLVGIHCSPGFLLGITDDFVLDRAARVEGCIGCICVSSLGAVATSVGYVGIRLSPVAQALWAVVFVYRIVSSIDTAAGATTVCAGSIMVSKVLPGSILVSSVGSEVLYYLVGFKEHSNLVVLEVVEFLLYVYSDDNARGGLDRKEINQLATMV
jgi:hypothetical protein